MEDFRRQILFLCVLVGGFAPLATAQGNYTVTDLGTLGGSVSTAYAINDLGQVVGQASTASGEMHAFVWANGVMTDLGVPGETSAAHGINSQGVIVGMESAKNVRGGAAQWTNGQRQSIGDLGPSGSGSTAICINDKGQSAGVSSGFATNQGVVRAVTWQNGVISDLGTLGGLHSTADGVNNQGAVVGWAELSDQSTVAFLWQNGVMRNLGTLPKSAIQPGSGSQAAAVNGTGQVVGSSLNSSGQVRAVLWNNGKITDLNSVIPRTSGLILTRATGINDQGQIVVEQQTDHNGPTRSLRELEQIWKPIGECGQRFSSLCRSSEAKSILVCARFYTSEISVDLSASYGLVFPLAWDGPSDSNGRMIASYFVPLP